ncbi:MAG: hypothetical protein JO019_02575 [Candidatus Kaiserbacteria bacterium]|nr:hypothetical protein [Candidatus Kaiserbacteria bacterium]
MLSLFPQILFLAPFSAFLIRLTLGYLLGYTAWKHLATPDWLIRVFGVLEVAVAASIILGIWTQAAALIAFVIALVWVLFPATKRITRSAALISLILCLSLLVTGAGAIAFDLPL